MCICRRRECGLRNIWVTKINVLKCVFVGERWLERSGGWCRCAIAGWTTLKWYKIDKRCTEFGQFALLDPPDLSERSHDNMPPFCVTFCRRIRFPCSSSRCPAQWPLSFLRASTRERCSKLLGTAGWMYLGVGWFL